MIFSTDGTPSRRVWFPVDIVAGVKGINVVRSPDLLYLRMTYDCSTCDGYVCELLGDFSVCELCSTCECVPFAIVMYL